jgi:Methyltransferase domain
VFDAVISQAVFEHLQHPAAAASEVWRTLKTDGTTKIDTAFLQPEHAYPHHYFNATEAGLKHWFRDFEIQWSGVEPYQHPKWALLWFLDVYLACMHPESQRFGTRPCLIGLGGALGS